MVLPFECTGELSVVCNVHAFLTKNHAVLIPRGLPTTHPSDGIGHISYRIQARGHMGTFSRDARYQVALGVWGDYDSTKMQLFATPKTVMNEKTFLFSGSGKAKCTVTFPQGAIVYPGSQVRLIVFSSRLLFLLNFLRLVAVHG